MARTVTSPPDKASEKPKGKEAGSTPDDLITTFRKRYEDAYERERENIDKAYEDLGFAEEEAQWDADVRKNREIESRPCLTINRLPQFIRQITGKMRQLRPAIKCVPVDSRGDPETAKTLAGMFRYIENRSRAQIVYGKAADSQVTCGIGAWRVTTEYSDEQTFNQEIRIDAIDDPVMTLFDPDASRPSKSDAMFCFVPVDMSRRKFEEEFPGKSPVGYEMRAHSAWEGWVSEDYVRVCEYWYKEPTKRELVLMPDGSVDDLTGQPEDIVAEKLAEVAALQAQGVEIRVEKRDSYKVMRCLVSAQDVLEQPVEWKGRYIPIIPVVGEEIRIGRKVVRRGIVRLAKDPQRMYNYFSSAQTEIVALQPKAPFIGTEKNFEEYEDIWQSANTENLPYLTYTPDPANGGVRPDRSQPPVSSQGLTEGANRSVEDMKAVIGIYDASLGARSNETSGKAIEARQQEGDTGSFVYVANFGEAISHTATVIMDLIPHVYDNARTIRIVGDDGTIEPTKINQPQGIAEDGVSPLANDVTIGAYDVVVKMGPAYDTLRSEAREGMTAMIQAGGPELFAITGDLMAKMQDWPNAEELTERLEAIAPPAIKALIAQKRGEPPEPPQPSPEAQAQAAQAQVEQGKNQLEMAKLELEGQKLQIEQEKIQFEREKMQFEMAKLQIQAATAMQPQQPTPEAMQPDPMEAIQTELMKTRALKEMDFEFESRRKKLDRDGAQAAEMGMSEDDAEPSEMGPSPIELLVQALAAQGQAIQAGLSDVGAGMQMLAQAQAAPRRVVRGPDGRVAGVEAMN